ncbi:hypothetical protein FISHEDRAFT_55825 [Fistulina hepatica ATCC 64428]|uniref:Uncharacterized protein n=1 Tax=Fistulina hepatica ATCC 64428 TaxID=1128425 RepID=A0A0D7AL38_9AGAR|nr:hypothetical protein FISHEDRAFT_55825 [Fistulina hepatica ATCC 64428]
MQHTTPHAEDGMGKSVTVGVRGSWPRGNEKGGEEEVRTKSGGKGGEKEDGTAVVLSDEERRERDKRQVEMSQDTTFADGRRPMNERERERRRRIGVQCQRTGRSDNSGKSQTYRPNHNCEMKCESAEHFSEKGIQIERKEDRKKDKKYAPQQERKRE